MKNIFKILLHQAKHLKSEIFVLYLVFKHTKTPWATKVLILFVVSYAFSPIDLIPDFIPVLGLLDDLILLPLGIKLCLKLCPEPVLNECRLKAKNTLTIKRTNWIAGGIILLIWIGGIISLMKYMWK